MKKKLLCTIAIFMLLIQSYQCVEAKNTALSAPMRVAIKKYKYGNYTGCLQDCQKIVKTSPTNATAYYYMAISYVQAGKKDEAIKSYSKVLSMKANSRLIEYATTGKRCLETPDKCHLESDTAAGANPEIDKLIARPATDALSDSVKKDFEKKRLEGLKNKINSDKDVDQYEFNRAKEFSRSKIETTDKIAENKPSDEEVQKALKILNDAGINPYASQNVMMPSAQSTARTPEEAQLQMLMGSNSQLNNNNAIMNMLPYMATQGQNGAGNFSPQVMQAVIMNSMMPDFTFNVNNDDNK